MGDEHRHRSVTSDPSADDGREGDVAGTGDVEPDGGTERASESGSERAAGGTERTAGAEPGDDESTADAVTTSEPGGGPRRVVSEESVDDILASLERTRSTGESPGATTERTVDDGALGPDHDDQRGSADDGDTRRERAGTDSDGADAPGDETGPAGDESDVDDFDGDGPSVDTDALSDDAGPLAGSVDVEGSRAARTANAPEPSGAADGSELSAAADAPEPSAVADGDESSDAETVDSTGRTGLLGRFKRLFSR